MTQLLKLTSNLAEGHGLVSLSNREELYNGRRRYATLTRNLYVRIKGNSKCALNKRNSWWKRVRRWLRSARKAASANVVQWGIWTEAVMLWNRWEGRNGDRCIIKRFAFYLHVPYFMTLMDFWYFMAIGRFKAYGFWFSTGHSFTLLYRILQVSHQLNRPTQKTYTRISVVAVLISWTEFLDFRRW